MRILIITYYFPPASSIGAIRPYHMAVGLRDLGHNVCVLTSTKPISLGTDNKSLAQLQMKFAHSPILNFLFEKLAIGSKPPMHQRRAHPGIGQRLKRSLRNIMVKRGLFLLGRQPDLFDLLFRPTLKIASEDRWDLVITSFAPAYAHRVGCRLKQAGRTRCWVADYRDLWTLHQEFRGLFPFNLLEARQERRLLQHADLVTTVSEQLAKSLRSFNKGKKTIVLPSAIDPALHRLSRQNLPKVGNMVLVYTGTIYKGWSSFFSFLEGLSIAARAEPQLASKLTVQFIGNDLAGLELRASALKLDSIVHFRSWVSRTEAHRIQQGASRLLFFDPDTATGITTGKVFEYVASGNTCWRVGPPHETSGLTMLKKCGTGKDIGNEPSRIAKFVLSLHRGEDPELIPDHNAIKSYYPERLANRLLTEIKNLEER